MGDHAWGEKFKPLFVRLINVAVNVNEAKPAVLYGSKRIAETALYECWTVEK